MANEQAMNPYICKAITTFGMRKATLLKPCPAAFAYKQGVSTKPV
jgi:hypothetical protein